MKSIARTANQDGASQAARTIPPLPYRTRIRLAGRLTWQTLRHGRDVHLESYFNGTRDGMDTMLNTMSYRLAQRTAARAQGGAR